MDEKNERRSWTVTIKALPGSDPRIYSTSVADPPHPDPEVSHVRISPTRDTDALMAMLSALPPGAIELPGIVTGSASLAQAAMLRLDSGETIEARFHATREQLLAILAQLQRPRTR